LLDLKFFPAKHAWAFVFGDAMLLIETGQPMFFADVKAARALALKRGIQVAEDGTCFTRSTILRECFEGGADHA
jgi:ribosomal protein RSM22 (predicted rRNA methylase)